MNKVVLVTGSSRGIGRSTIIEFASHGYDVIINFVNGEAKAFELCDYVKNTYSVDAIAIKCDIANEEEVKNMFNIISDKFGRLDVLVNNAGISMDNNIDDKSYSEFMKVLSVNLGGPFLTCKYAKKIMNSGSIINVSSTNGIDTNYKESIDYDASKAGLNSLTKNLALELSPNIRVNAVACGWVNTDVNQNLNPDFKESELSKILLNRFAESNEIAKVIYFLASDDASYINGSIIRVDGGFKGE